MTLLGALGLGTGSMLNSTLLGGAAYLLGNIGRGVEHLSPFSGETIDDSGRNILANVGYMPEQVSEMFPYKDSWITSAAKGSPPPG